MRRIKKCLALFAAVLVMLSILPFQAMADGSGSITLTFTPDDVAADGAEFSIYRALDITDDGYTYCNGFEGHGLKTLDYSSTADDVRGIAQAAKGIAEANDIEPVATEYTNSAGQVTFSGLEDGVYLVVGKIYQKGSYIYTPAPTLLEVRNGADVEAEIKSSDRIVPDENTKVIRKVLKAWKNDDSSARPESITVTLLCNGEVYDTKTLKSSDNWRYTWKELDANCDWDLVETDVPDGYEVSIVLEGGTFVVTNTYTAPTPTLTPAPETEPTATPEATATPGAPLATGNSPNRNDGDPYKKSTPTPTPTPAPTPQFTTDSPLSSLTPSKTDNSPDPGESSGTTPTVEPGTPTEPVPEGGGTGISGSPQSTDNPTDISWTSGGDSWNSGGNAGKTDTSTGTGISSTSGGNGSSGSSGGTSDSGRTGITHFLTGKDDSEEPQTLPQTGLLQTPIFVLAGIGMILLLIALAAFRDREGRIVPRIVCAAGAAAIVSAGAIAAYNAYLQYNGKRSAEEALAKMTFDTPIEEDEAGEVIYPDYVLNPDMEMPYEEIDGYQYIGKLDMPAIGISLPVIKDWSWDALKVSPCAYSGTIYKKNMVIAGHNYSSHFSGIKNLQEGDEVIFTDIDGNVFRYAVAQTEILTPDKVAEMCNSEFPLTLFTCTAARVTRYAVRCNLL